MRKTAPVGLETDYRHQLVITKVPKNRNKRRELKWQLHKRQAG